MKQFIFLGALLFTAKSIPSESKSDSGLVHDKLHNPTDIKLEWGKDQTLIQISPSGEENVYKIIIKKPPDCSAFFQTVSGETVYEELQNKGKELQAGKCDGMPPLYFTEKYPFKMLEIDIHGFQVTPAGHARTAELPIVQVLAANYKPNSHFLQCLNDTFTGPARRFSDDFYRCTVAGAYSTKLYALAFVFALIGRNRIFRVVEQGQNTARRVITCLHLNAYGLYNHIRSRRGWIQASALASHRKTM